MRLRPLFVLCCLPLLGFNHAHAAAPLAQQRQLYDEASRALERNDPTPYLRNRAALNGYPLEAYLAYSELLLRLPSASDAEVEQFLNQHGDLPQMGELKVRWLRDVAARGDWARFNRYYSADANSTELDCLAAEGQFAQGQQAAALESAKRLWLTGKDVPMSSCVRVFGRWQAQGGLNESYIWQRLELAAENKNYSLANNLQQSLVTPRVREAGQLLLDLAQKPEQLAQRPRVPADASSAEAVAFGLRRLARQDAPLAAELLAYYRTQLPFSAEDEANTGRSIALTLAKRFDASALPLFAQYDPDLRDATGNEWRLRLLLRLGRFAEAHQLTQKLPAEQATHSRWRYWQARSLQLAQPGNQAVSMLYQNVANERDFYGFMAADYLAQPYRIDHRPAVIAPSVAEKVRRTPGIQRAIELNALGQTTDGRREWYHASRQFDRDALIAQARLGYNMGWYFPAIRTISQARYWDDLDVRFPVVHRDTFAREANTRGISTTWAFAITRQESGFMSDARSGVGAMGLMQLMPDTARETARKFSIPLRSPQQTLDPEVNIQLGAAYLSQVYRQFDSNRILASAAYNAGPGRVRQWLRDGNAQPVDVWIETIPFDETRQYVQNVLSYAVIYGEKLGNPQKLIEPHEYARF